VVLGSSTFTSYPSRPVPIPLEYDLHSSRRRRYTLLALLGAVAIMLVGWAVAIEVFFQSRPRDLVLATIIAGGTMLVSIGSYAGIVLVAARSDKSEEQPDQQRSAQSPADANEARLAEYHKISRKQAESSYRFSEVAIAVGFLFLVVGGVIAIRTDSASVQVVVGALASLGGAFSAYIGSTFIRTYNRALAQMNYYYAQPLVQSYILKAEQLSREVSPAQKDLTVNHIIDVLLDSATMAARLITPGSSKRTAPDADGSQP